MRKENSNFETKYLTEAGRKLENKDYFAFVEEDDFACWVMASSIDESETQNSAELAVKSVLDSFILAPSITTQSLANLIKEANATLKYESSRSRLQASIMIVVTDYINIRYASSGNVHLQCINNDKKRFYSKDQSFYQEMIDEAMVPSDRSYGFEERNNLTEYLGKRGKLKPFISEKRKLRELDSLVMTTVGLWEHLTDIEIIDAMQEAKSSQEVIDNLEELLLSGQPQELNNYTIAIIMVNKLFEKSKKNYKMLKRAVIIAVPILLILGMLLFMSYRNSVKRAEKIDKIENFVKKADQFVKEGNFKRALEKYDSALKEKDGIKKFNAHEIELKQKMAQLLVDANTSGEKDENETAKNLFVKARDLKIDHEKVLEIYPNSYLTDKFNYYDTKMYISELEKLGDTQTEAEQYAEAQASYKKAKQEAILLNDQNKIKDLNVKIDTAKTQQDIADKDKIKADADREASQAEQATGDTPDEDLASRYDKIADQYDEAGFHDKASQMRAKSEELKAATQKDYNTKQEKVAEKLETDGDTSLGKKEYDMAIGFYQGAQKIYQNIGNDARVLQVQRKIDTITNLRLFQAAQASQGQ